jgi:PTH1 family peptidyl-tRNA hydrolase
MYVIVGLGNPGSQYDETRHNVGFMLLDDIASECGSSFTQNRFQAQVLKTTWHDYEIFLMKPQTFMNLSGGSVAQALSYFKIPEKNLIVVSDDLDQDFGAVRSRIGGGHGGHNGIRNILEKIPSDKFHRVKIGIGKPAHKGATVDWVLHRFKAFELKALYEESFPTAKTRILEILKHQK